MLIRPSQILKPFGSNRKIHWRSGAPVFWGLADQGGSMVDATDSHNPITNVGGVTSSRMSRGPSLALNGSTGYFQTTGTSFSFERTQPFTVSIRTTFTNANNEECLIGNLNTSSNFQGWELHKEASGTPTYANKINCFLINSYSSNCIQQHWNFIPSVGVEYTLKWTYDGSSKAAGNNLYVNGVLQVRSITEFDSLTGSIVSSQPLRIGARTNGSIFHGGNNDDVRIYNYALTPSQVLVDYLYPWWRLRKRTKYFVPSGLSLVSTKNKRRSVIGIGLSSNIIPPVPDGVITDFNSDGNDFKHLAGFYRGDNPSIVLAGCNLLGNGILFANSFKTTKSSIQLMGVASEVCSPYKKMFSQIIFQGDASDIFGCQRTTSTGIVFSSNAVELCGAHRTASGSSSFMGDATIGPQGLKKTSTSLAAIGICSLNPASFKKTSSQCIYFPSAKVPLASVYKTTSTNIGLDGLAATAFSSVRTRAGSIALVGISHDAFGGIRVATGSISFHGDASVTDSAHRTAFGLVSINCDASATFQGNVILTSAIEKFSFTNFIRLNYANTNYATPKFSNVNYDALKFQNTNYI